MNKATPVKRPLWLWFNSSQARWLVVPLAVFIFTRAFVFAGAYLPSAFGIDVLPPDVEIAGDNDALSKLVRWDALHYYNIATVGYRYVPGTDNSDEATVAFFPLYPLLVRVLSPIGGAALAGVAISNMALLGALILLYRVTKRAFNPRAAAYATLYLAAFPSAFFFSVLYAESLFLLLVLAAYSAVQEKRWWLASFWAMLAGATRISGVFMMLFVAMKWAQAHGWRVERVHRADSWRALWRGVKRDWQTAAALFIMPLGVFAYMAYLQAAFGDPLAFLSARGDAWGRHFSGPIGVIIEEIRAMLAGEVKPHVLPYFDSINIGLFFLVVGLSVAVWRKLSGAAAIYCLASLFFAAAVTTQSLNRHLLAYFPIFMVLGAWGVRYPKLHRALLFIFLPLLMLFTALYVNWVFIG